MLADARISLLADFDRDNLSNLRRFDQADLELLYEALEDFLSGGSSDELRAMHANAREFVEPLPGMTGHPDHVEIRQALRRAAEVFNAGFADATFGIAIDLDETFGVVGSEADSPRPTCVRMTWVDGELVVEYNWLLATFDEEEPTEAEYEVEDVLAESDEDEDALSGLGILDSEVQYRMVLRYTFTETEDEAESAK